MTDRLLPAVPDADVRIECLDDHWHVGCYEPFCGAEEGYPTFTYNQAQRWRTTHCKAHADGIVTVPRNYFAAWDQFQRNMKRYGYV